MVHKEGMRIVTPSVLAVLSIAAAPADAATWTIGPDRCPAPALAAAYTPEATVISPDARDGMRPAARTEAEWWPPAAVAVRVPGGWPAVVWVDGDIFESGERANDCALAAPASE